MVLALVILQFGRYQIVLKLGECKKPIRSAGMKIYRKCEKVVRDVSRDEAATLHDGLK